MHIWKKNGGPTGTLGPGIVFCCTSDQGHIVQGDAISLEPLYEHRVIFGGRLNDVVVHGLLQECGRDQILLVKQFRDIQHDVRSDVQ